MTLDYCLSKTEHRFEADHTRITPLAKLIAIGKTTIIGPYAKPSIGMITRTDILTNKQKGIRHPMRLLVNNHKDFFNGYRFAAATGQSGHQKQSGTNAPFFPNPQWAIFS